MTSPTATVVRTEAKLFARDPASMFWIVVFPPALVGILGLIPAMREEIEELGIPVIALYVPVGIMLAMLMAGISAMPVVIASYREQRILRRVATTPAKPRDILLAQYVIHGGAAALGGVLATLLAVLAFGVDWPQNPIAYVGVFLLILAAALAIGGVISGLAPTGKIATTIGTVLIFPLMFTAGVWIPVAAMPNVLSEVVSFTPFGAAALALDAAAAGDWPAWRDVLVVTAWAGGLGAFAARIFRWE